MKLNNGALMKSAGIGVVVRILFAICASVGAFAPLAGNSVDIATLGLISTVGTVLCLCGWIITLGIGFSYVYFAVKDGPVSMGDGALGGAAATGIAGVVGGLLSGCLVLVAPIAAASSASGGSSVDYGALLAGGAVGALGAVCIGFIVGAIVGAIGGVIGAATVGKPKA